MGLLCELKQGLFESTKLKLEKYDCRQRLYSWLSVKDLAKFFFTSENGSVNAKTSKALLIPMPIPSHVKARLNEFA
jgi:hypothetical protein